MYKIGDHLWFANCSFYKSGRCCTLRKPTEIVLEAASPEDYRRGVLSGRDVMTGEILIGCVVPGWEESWTGSQSQFQFLYRTAEEAIEGFNAKVQNEIDKQTSKYEDLIKRLKKKFI